MTSTAPNNRDASWSLWLAGLATSACGPDADPAGVTLAARVALSRIVRVLALGLVAGAGLLAATQLPRTADARSTAEPAALELPASLQLPPDSRDADTTRSMMSATPTLAAMGSLVARPVPTDVPATLAETGLYADWASKTVAADLLAFSPQYPLWSDGATKQRWIYLPAAIDASDADAWVFPVGTRIWKQFSFGARAETRYMVLTAAGWKYATYVWTGDSAVRAPREGVEVDITSAQTSSADGTAHARHREGHADGTAPTHRVPSEIDCRACHANAKSPVLGFASLQLSIDRDPRAPHRELETRDDQRVDLLSLAIGGYISVDDIAPRIAGTPTQRAALGYLHGNCGGCHRAEGPLAGLGMVLAQPAHGGDVTLRSTVGVTAKFAPTTAAPMPRITPGDAPHSLLIVRMQARRTLAQMPPIGTDVVDAEAVRLVADWIDQLASPKH